MDRGVCKHSEVYTKSDQKHVKKQWAAYFVDKGLCRHADGPEKAPVELQAIDSSLLWGECAVLCQVALLRVSTAMRRWEHRTDTTGGMPASLVDR